MKVSLRGLYDPATNFGLEDVVITLCRGMRVDSFQKLTAKKAELALSLRQARLDNTDLNKAISNVIPLAADLYIDFNELNDIETKNPQIDVTMYDTLYGFFGTAAFAINELRDFGEYPRRLAILNALCDNIFDLDPLEAGEDYESIERDIKNMIQFFGPKINTTMFNQFYNETLGPNSAERILQEAGLYNPPEKQPAVREQKVASPDIQGTRPGAGTPKDAMYYFRNHSPGLPSFNLSNTLKRVPSFRGFIPIVRSNSNSEANSRAHSPTSPIRSASSMSLSQQARSASPTSPMNLDSLFEGLVVSSRPVDNVNGSPRATSPIKANKSRNSYKA
jgi:hypothetical protein